MAQLAVAAIGAGLGYGLFGSATFLGVSAAGWGWTIGNLVGNTLFAPDLPDQQGPRLSDLTVQASTEGAGIPQVWGTWRLAGNVIWSTDLVETSTTETSGGKGGGGGASVTRYSYSVSFAVALCDGPIGGVRRIWADGKLIYDTTAASIPTSMASESRAASIRIYTGTETQLPDPTIQAHVGAANTPAYRGTAYVVFESLQLADFANRIPNITVEVMATTSITRPALIRTFSTAWNPVFDAIIAAAGTHYAVAYVDGLIRTDHQLSDVGMICRWTTDQVLIGRDYWVNSNLLTTHINSGNHPGLSALATAPTSAWLFKDATSAAMYPPAELGSPWHSNAQLIKLGNYVLIWRPVPVTGGYNYTIARFVLDGDMPQTLADRTRVAFFATAVTATWHVHTTDDTLYALDYGVNPGTLYQFDADLNLLRQWSVGNCTTCQGMFWVTGNLCYISGAFFGRINSDGTTTSESAVVYGVTAPAKRVHIPGLAWSEVDVVSLQGVATPGPVALSTIVSDLCQQAGLSAGDINVSALTDSVLGYTRPRPMAARQAIEPLMRWHLSDATETGGKIKWIKRGGASSATLTAEDLCRIDDDVARVTRAQESDLPIEVSVAFVDQDRDHQPGLARARLIARNTSFSASEEFPILATSGIAAQVADILLREPFAGRMKYEFTLPPKYAALDPADVISLPVADSLHAVRITRVQSAAGGPIRCEAISESQHTYSSSAGAGDDNFGDQIISYAGVTLGILMDLPALRDQDNSGAWTVAATGYLPGWRGAMLYESADAGGTWDEAEALIDRSAWGTAWSVLGAGRTDMFDETNRVIVQLIDSSAALVSATELAVLNGANAAAIGAHGRWEIIQYKTASQNVDGTWTLSGLLRGRRGTEWTVGTHQNGDNFVPLVSSALRRLDVQSAAIGAVRHWRFVTLGQPIETVTPIAATYSAMALECYAPVQLGGGRDASGNITITWVRRNRIAADWRDLVDVPMSEATQSYEVEVWDGSGYNVLKRTITGLSTPTASYTSAQQVTDFGGNQATVYLRVYQLSAVSGRGMPLQGSI